MFLHVSVILSTGGGGSTWAGTPPGRYTPWAGTPPTPNPPGRYTPSPGRYTPLGRYTPGRYTPPGAGTPSGGGEQCMLGDTGNKRAVRITLESILVYNCMYNCSKIKLFADQPEVSALPVGRSLVKKSMLFFM